MPVRLLFLLLCALASSPPAHSAVIDGAIAAPTIEKLSPAGAVRGAVLVVHGGGWREVGAGRLARVRPWAERFRSWGYEVWSTTYRPGRGSFADVLAAYDGLRDSRPRSEPICLYGQSAGAQLALLVAARRPGADGVISAAGPVDLPSLPTSSRWMAVAAFGDELRRFSPLTHAARLTAPLLLEYARHDRLVPRAQGEALAAAVARPTLIAPRVRPLRADASRPRNTLPWVHGWVTRRAAQSVIARERRWLARVCSV